MPATCRGRGGKGGGGGGGGGGGWGGEKNKAVESSKEKGTRRKVGRRENKETINPRHVEVVVHKVNSCQTCLVSISRPSLLSARLLVLYTARVYGTS